MKILCINYEFPPLGGGGGRANGNIAKHMVQMGHEVVILTSAFKGLPETEMKDGFQLIRIPTLRRYLEKCRIYEMIIFMISSFYYSMKQARAFKPDICIAFFTIPSGPAAWLVKKVFGVPYIISLRGGDVPGFMKEDLNFYHSISKPIIRFLWKGACAVVANSRGLKLLAQNTAGDIDVKMIPNGVDAAYFQSDHPRPVFAEAQGVTRLLSVGRLNPQKGMDVLLRAFALLRDQVSVKTQLWIVGDGPLRKSLEDLAKSLKIEQDVFFFGWRSQEELASFYSSADIFVLSSHYEGMPNVVLEAMACGLPIVATDVSGTGEIIGHGENGYLVKPDDPTDLAFFLKKMLHSGEMEKMSADSLLKSKSYDWQQVANGYIKLCQTAV